MAEFNFNGKTVMITGAGTGIGAAIARGFAGAGAHVAVNDLNGLAAERVAKDIRTHGGSAAAWMGDMSLSAPIKKLLADVRKWKKQLDISDIR